jgi:basic membrane lipoprotein Med (substrate-binding protein (PBP1-ABC) superfamily)
VGLLALTVGACSRENFRQYGAQGYSLVFGHGFEFQDVALRVAPEFPRTVYVTTSGTSTARNIAGMEFAFEAEQSEIK